MAVETVTIGRLTLHEDFPGVLSADTAGAFSLSGIEYEPTMTATTTKQLAEDIRSLPGALVPVYWSNRPETALYARVTAAEAAVTRYGSQADVVTWKATLERLGTDAEADVESRLSGPQTRSTDFAVTGERWHAPAAEHYAYWVGSNSPGLVTRAGSSAPIKVYRSLPLSINPRWGCTPAEYLSGAVTFTDVDTIRTGSGFTAGLSTWELSNDLLRVSSVNVGSGRSDFSVYHFSGGDWRQKVWTIDPSATYGPPVSVTVLYNTPEQAAVRVLFAAPDGRVAVDLTLHRGARFVEVYVQAANSTTLSLRTVVAEAATNATGYVRATANDVSGDRALVGSAHNYTAILTNIGLSRASTTTLDAAIGVEVGGTSAVSGDQAAQIYAQYLGTPGEYEAIVRR